MDKAKYSIDELSELTGFSRRTIRYYIQEELLEPPAGRGRGGFYYDSHFKRLSEIKSMQQGGMRLDAISRYLKQGQITPDFTEAKLDRAHPYKTDEVWIKHEIIPGLEMNVRQELEAKRGESISAVLKLMRSIFKEDTGSGNE